MKVMVIIPANEKSEGGQLPSEKALAEMMQFNEELSKAGIMLAGEGLHPTSKAKRVRFAGDQRTVIDGPFAETKELIAGFWIWQVDSMEEAASLFALMQARGREDWTRKAARGEEDPRPRLAAALMDAMRSVIPPGPFESFPVLLTRRLMERQSVRDLGLDERVSWPARALFSAVMGAARGVDAAMRLARAAGWQHSHRR